MNPARDRFHCWHCDFAGGSLAALMLPHSNELREYLSSRPSIRRPVQRETRPLCHELPRGFRPLDRSEPDREAPYRNYLLGRNLSERTVALYRMGYVDDGPLAGRVVVPSFDRFGSINFWSARSIWSDTKHEFRYRLPDASKDVISNEHTVDWTKPVYLVEGIFDEIAVGSQAVALYGKNLPTRLAVRLVETRPPMTYVCLDSDALDDAYDLMRILVGYDLPCAVVDLDAKDPGIAGREIVESAAVEAPRVTGSLELLKARL